MTDLNINDYSNHLDKNAQEYFKENQKAITKLINQAYHKGKDDNSDEFAQNIITELFIDIIKSWIKTEQEVENNTWVPQYEIGFTQATIQQLSNIADTASSYDLVNNIELETAAKYFKDHYGDTEPTELLFEIKDILSV